VSEQFRCLRDKMGKTTYLFKI